MSRPRRTTAQADPLRIDAIRPPSWRSTEGAGMSTPPYMPDCHLANSLAHFRIKKPRASGAKVTTWGNYEE